MKKIEIYDPAMCCSTGVCGPSVDPDLMRMATVINTLSKQGIDIKRHNLSDNPQAFIANRDISDSLTKNGVEVLPITLVDGVIAKTATYPTNNELEQWLSTSIPNVKMGEEACCGSDNDDQTDCCGSQSCC